MCNAMRIMVQEVRTRIVEVPTDDFSEGKEMARAILDEIQYLKT